MAERMSEKNGNASVRTHKSRSSRLSTSSAAVRARAVAQAAKVRAEFAEKEAQLKVERATTEAELGRVKADLELGKAKLEAELSALESKKEAAAAEAQAEALESAELQENSVHSDSSSHEVLQEEIATRTQEYVAAQTELRRHSIPLSLPIP